MSAALAAAVLCLSPQVHDGDSLRCGGERVRIAGIDAPELAGSPSCSARHHGRTAWCDYALGVKARDALIKLIAGRRVTFIRRGTDRYGRTLATVLVDEVDVGAWLIERGLAREWR